MKKLSILLSILLLLFALKAPSVAGWWIFGQGTDEVLTNFIYINQNSFDETGQDITLFKQTLKDGAIRITGRASVRNARIGAVMVTTDNKATWQKANLSDNGYFEYIFRPQVGEEYNLYIKIIDTTGKTNDVDSTYKKITVTNENLYDKISQSLNSLVETYQNEDPAAFMKYVSDNFAGDYGVLDFAIRKDFNAFDFIQLRLFINNISMDNNSGRVYVAIQYIRKVVSTKSGRVLADNGYTEFVFQNVGGMFKVFSMKNPLLFGLSDAGEIATGTILNNNNEPMLLVDRYGNVEAQSFRTAIDIIENDSAIAGIESGTVVVQTGSNDIAGYNFMIDGMAPNELQAPAGSGVKQIPGNPDINSVNIASVSGSDMDIIGLIVPTGSYAILLPDGKYMLIMYTAGHGPGSTIKYRFQPDGTNSFN